MPVLFRSGPARLGAFAASPRSTVTPPLRLVQSATTTNLTPFTTNTATFARTPKPGNLLVLALACDKSAPNFRPHVGFQALIASVSTSVSMWVGWKPALGDGSDTTLTIDHDVGTDAAGDRLWIAEFETSDNVGGGVWTVLARAAVPTNESTLLAATTGTTGPTTAFGGALAFWSIDSSSSNTTGATPAYTNGFDQLLAYDSSGRGGLTVAWRNGIGHGVTSECTQTHVGTADQMSVCIAVFNKVIPVIPVPSRPGPLIHPGRRPATFNRFPATVPGVDTGTGVDIRSVAAAAPLGLEGLASPRKVGRPSAAAPLGLEGLASPRKVGRPSVAAPLGLEGLVSPRKVAPTVAGGALGLEGLVSPRKVAPTVVGGALGLAAWAVHVDVRAVSAATGLGLAGIPTARKASTPSVVGALGLAGIPIARKIVPTTAGDRLGLAASAIAIKKAPSVPLATLGLSTLVTRAVLGDGTLTGGVRTGAVVAGVQGLGAGLAGRLGAGPGVSGTGTTGAGLAGATDDGAELTGEAR